MGSGVIIDKEKGYIVTNNHVVKDADHIVVRLGPGDDVLARLVGADPKTDLAVLQVKADLRVQAEWGDSDQLTNGDWVLAIGSPVGLDHSVTAGIVSATERNDVKLTEYESYIQTDAAINPGNSGGPLIDLSGKVVGINTAIISETGGYEGIGLAIPSVAGAPGGREPHQNGEGRSRLPGRGDSSRSTPRWLATSASRTTEGALVAEVQPGSPAEHAGLKSGDVIIKVGDREVANPASLRNLTAGLDVGAQVPVTYYRAGKTQTATVTIDELPPAPEVLSSLGFNVRPHPAGPDGVAASIEIDQVVAGGPAFQVGLRPRMRILAVGKESVATIPQFEIAVRKINPRLGLPLLVQTTDGRVIPVLVGGDRVNKQP